MKKGTLYFFTGLSGAGKTTLGELFYAQLKKKHFNTVILDGDEVPCIIGDDLGYSTHDRKIGAYRLIHMAKMLTDQGINVVLCSISMYKEVRRWNRENIPNYVEIYVNASMETLKKLNKKNLYSGEVKEVVGMDLPCDYPEHPDVEIHNDWQETPEEIIEELIKILELA